MRHSSRMIERVDRKRVVALAEQHHAESRYATRPFDAKRATMLVNACLDMDQYGGAVLVDDLNAVVGYIALTVEPAVYADMRIARELALYVEPPNRTFPGTRKLIACAEAWAKRQGAAQFDLGASSSTDKLDLFRVGQLYEHLGYTFHGISYVKELEG